MNGTASYEHGPNLLNFTDHSDLMSFQESENRIKIKKLGKQIMSFSMPSFLFIYIYHHYLAVISLFIYLLIYLVIYLVS